MDSEHTDLMTEIEQVLMTAPAIAVPNDFAARVMARIPAERSRPVAFPALQVETRFGRVAMIAAMLVLLAGMIALAPLTRGSSLWLMLQALLLTQLGSLVLVFGRTRRSVN